MAEGEVSVVPFLLQMLIGVIMIGLFFGPGIAYINPLFKAVGVDLSLLRWPIAFVIFDIFGIPSLFIALFMWDLYTKGGHVAAIISFTNKIPHIGEYLGPLVASFFDFLSKIVTPPQTFFKIGIGALSICTQGNQTLACAGMDNAVSLFGKELALTLPLPPIVPVILILIWMVFSIIISIPRFLVSLIKLIEVFVHALFLLFRAILILIEKLLSIFKLDSAVEALEHLVESVENLLQSILRTFGAIIGTIGYSLKVVTLPLFFVILVARIIILFLLIFFATKSPAIAVFGTGLLLSVDGVALGVLIQAIAGALIAVVGLVMVGLL